ncbi:MAG: hypothetical protein ACLQNE_44180 [Thermoguttaceae bacterium]
MSIVASFRKKVFSLHDISPREVGEDGGYENQPFVLAGKWPSSAAKRPSRAAKCASWGCQMAEFVRAFEDRAMADHRRMCSPVNGLRQWLSHRRFLQPRQVQRLYLQTASHVARKTRVLKFRHNSAKGGEN